MKKTLEEIAGYQEPAHLIKTIKELEAKVAKLEDDLHTANEKVSVAESLLELMKREVNRLTRD
jgi:hypothetical protein